MPSQIQGGGPGSPSALLTRAFRLAGRFPTFIDEVLVGAVTVADLSQAGPIPITRIAAAAFTQTSVALENCQFRLEVPPGITARVTRIWTQVSGVAASYINVGFGATLGAPANIADKAFSDGRLRVVGETPAGVLSYGTAVGAIAAPHTRIGVIPDPGHDTAVDWVFGRPDAFDFIEFQSALVNEVCRAAVEWIETVA